ncbi:hypothetical protein P2318_12175 [Myxococcaceae bacterium GXIMD 01537]
MLKKTSSHLIALLLFLGSPVVMAAESNLSCPAGTKQFGGRETMTDRGVFCVKSGSEHGIPVAHGPYVSFHPNGQKKAVGQNVDGFRTGLWTFYAEDGSKVGTANFKGGNYHGEVVELFPSGKVRKVEQFAEGLRHGTVKEYAEDGKLVKQTEYRENRVVADK